MKIYYITCALGNKIYFNPRASSPPSWRFYFKNFIQQENKKGKFLYFELEYF